MVPFVLILCQLLEWLKNLRGIMCTNQNNHPHQEEDLNSGEQEKKKG